MSLPLWQLKRGGSDWCMMIRRDVHIRVARSNPSNQTQAGRRREGPKQQQQQLLSRVQCVRQQSGQSHSIGIPHHQYIVVPSFPAVCTASAHGKPCMCVRVCRCLRGTHVVQVVQHAGAPRGYPALDARQQSGPRSPRGLSHGSSSAIRSQARAAPVPAAEPLAAARP